MGKTKEYFQTLREKELKKEESFNRKLERFTINEHYNCQSADKVADKFIKHLIQVKCL